MLRPITPVQLTIDIVIAVMFGFVAFIVDAASDGGMPGPIAGAALVAVLMGSAIAVSRLSPVISLSAAWAGAIVQMAFGRQPGLADLAVFVALFAAAAYGSRRVFWAGLASVVVGAVTITAYLFSTTPLWDASVLAGAVSILVAALFGLGLSFTLGALVRTARRARETRRARDAAEAETAAEQERVRIARDMHDVVAHSLTVVVAQADGARYAARADPDAAADALTTISATARAALADVRLLLTQLRHSQGDGPQPTLADLEGLFAQVRASGLDLRVDVDPAPAAAPPASVQLAVYRILQEALTNALRHGAGGAVDVRLAWHADRVELAVRNAARSDDGAAAPRAGHGLIGMRERAQLVGGRLDAGREEEGMFVVTGTLPIGDAA